MYNLLLLILESLVGMVLVAILTPSVGLVVLKRAQIKLSPSLTFLLSWVLGIAVLSGTAYGGGLVFGPQVFSYIGWASVICAGIVHKRLWQMFKDLIEHSKTNILFISFLFVAALILAGTLMGSWVPLAGGIQIQDGQQQDSLWHIALTRQLLISVPPVHPSSFELTVSNYHYFYNILIALFAQTFSLKITTLYYQVFPLITCLLLAMSVALAAGYPKDKTAGFWSVFLTFFCGSFAYLIPFFLPDQSWHDSSFWVSQTFSMMVNPQLLLSYSSLLTIFLCYRSQKKVSLSLILITGTLTVSLLGIKAYGWILALILSLCFFAFYFFNSDKKIQTIFYIGLWMLLQGLGYLAVLGLPKTSAFTFFPLWYLSSMVESPDRLNLPYWKILEDHYRAHHNWLRVLQIQLKELFYFTFGNLGSRSILIFASVPYMYSLYKKTPNPQMREHLALGATLTAALTLPLLFIQSSGPVWNSIQFWYYGLILGNVLVAQVLSVISRNIRSYPVRLLLALLFIGLSVPTFFTTVPYKYQKRFTIPQNFIDKLTMNVHEQDRVIICANARSIYDTSLISALTGARPLLAHPVQIELMYGSLIKEKEDTLHRVFSTMSDLHSAHLNQLIKDNEIKYALCLQKNDDLTATSLIVEELQKQ